MPESDSSELFMLTYKCPIDWDSMSGDDLTRHCDKCNHSVVNVSISTKEQVDELFNQVKAGKRACVRFDSSPEQTDRKVSTIRRLLRSALPNWSLSRSVRHALVASVSMLLSAIKFPVPGFAQTAIQAPSQPAAVTKTQDEKKKTNTLEITNELLLPVSERSGQLGWVVHTNSELLQRDLNLLFEKLNGIRELKNNRAKNLLAKVKRDAYESKIIVLDDLLDLADAFTKDNSFVGTSCTLDLITRSGTANDQTLAKVKQLRRKMNSKEIDFKISEAEIFTNEKQYEKAFYSVLSAAISFRCDNDVRTKKREELIRLSIANLHPYAPTWQQEKLDSLNKNLTNDPSSKDVE